MDAYTQLTARLVVKHGAAFVTEVNENRAVYKPQIVSALDEMICRVPLEYSEEQCQKELKKLAKGILAH